MTAYMVWIKEETLDQKELDIYKSKIWSTFEGHELKILSGYDPFEVIEGEPIEGLVIFEFPSAAAARAWYDSPAYQAIVGHRHKGGRYRGYITDARKSSEPIQIT